MKKVLEEQIKRLPDKIIMEGIKKHDHRNWRKWGDNQLKMMAKEAHRRGLIK